MLHRQLWSVGVGSLAICAGCSAAAEAGDDGTGTAQQSIWNGSAVPAGTRQDVVWVRHPVSCSFACGNPPPPCNANCTGTLLRNNVVLTARHCVTESMEVGGPLVAPSTIRVYPSQSNTDFVTVSQMQQGPTGHDVVALFLNSPLPVAGITWAHQTPIYPYRVAEHQNTVLPVYGYGLDGTVNPSNNCKKISGPSMRSGQVRVSSTTFPDLFQSGGVTVKAPIEVDPQNGAPWSGDSGSAMFSPLSYPASAYGVLSMTSALLGLPPPEESYYGSPENYRSWVLNRVVDETPDLFDRFTASTSLDVYDRLGHGGSSQNWTWTSTAVQESSTSGPKYAIHRAQIMENAIVSARVRLGDYAGVIARWVDEEHYYMARFRDSNNRAEILKRSNGAWSTLASTTGGNCNFSWFNNPTIYLTVTGSTFQAAIVDDANAECTLLAQDTEYPTGRTGVYKENGTFRMDEFSVVHVGASAGGWNRP